mmetsp:Transcript_21292/g.29832  ORF Transcript_21292/g.29832 Transcript_21292/m.29832 type:complete len:210 (-) Transcript_21292:49-678(-)
MLPSSFAASSSSSSSPAEKKTTLALENLDRCRRYKEAAFKDKRVSFLMKMLAVYGCPVQQHDFVHCMEFPKEIKANGSFRIKEDDTVDIVLGSNVIKSEKDTTRILRHELIHALDHCKYDVKWSDPKQMACSEIRAASLSGDCDYITELARGANPSMSNHHKKCVRRRAAFSIRHSPTSPNMTQLKAEEHVDAVFEDCYKDTSPFGCIP